MQAVAIRLVHVFAGALLAGLALGCVAGSGPQDLDIPPARRDAEIRLRLQIVPAPGVPSLQASGGRTLLAVVKPWSIDDMARLEIVPYVLTAGTTFQPIDRNTGLPTTASNRNVLKKTFTAPLADAYSQVAIGKLAANKTYRIYARAFRGNGAQISDDASSSVDVTVSEDDRPTIAPLPLHFIQKVFAATTSVTLRGLRGRPLGSLRVELYTVDRQVEVAVPGASTSLDAAFAGSVVNLGNLSPRTTYRLKASALAADGSTIATNSKDIAITDNTVVNGGELQVDSIIVSTVAGLAGASGATNGATSSARFHGPDGLALDSAGNLYVADSLNYMIRVVSPSGVVSTYAGTGEIGFGNGPRGTTALGKPIDLVFGTGGDLFFLQESCQVRRISAAGNVSTLATIPGGNCLGIGTASADRLLVTQKTYTPAASKIHQVAADGTVTDYLGGSSGPEGSQNGDLSVATAKGPRGIAGDSGGSTYFIDAENYLVRKITSGGLVSTLAGSGKAGYADGTGTAASLANPFGIAVDAAGTLYVSDWGAHTIRKISPSGVVTTLAGKASFNGGTDGMASFARFKLPRGIAIDADGNLFVADAANHTIRKIVQ